MAGLKIQQEHSLLRQMIACEDVWPEFMQLFGRTIYGELRDAGITAQHDQEDWYQDLAYKLYSQNCIMIQRHLDRDDGMSFKAVLRITIRNMIRSHFRLKKNKERPESYDPTDYAPFIRSLFGTSKSDNPEDNLIRETLVLDILQDVTRDARDNSTFPILYGIFVLDKSVSDLGRQFKKSLPSIYKKVSQYLKIIAKDDVHAEEIVKHLNDR